jgi:hypothetical protein
MHHARGARASLLASNPYVSVIGQADRVTMYELHYPEEPQAGMAPLIAGSQHAGATEGVAGAASVPVPFRNGSVAPYRHPDPITPTALVARWYDDAGKATGEHAVKGVLPLALAPGETATRELHTAVPSDPGDYRLVVCTAAIPEQTLADVTVHVRRPSSQ